MKKLSKKQREVLEAIKDFIRAKGFPPSVREINSIFGFKSPAASHNFLKILEKKGYIRRSGKNKSRNYEVIGFSNRNFIPVPLVGRVVAGEPVISEENIECYYDLDASITTSDEVFLLKVDGHSMIDANIFDGDMILVKKQPIANYGDIVVAFIDGELTVKRFLIENDQVVLKPENKEMEPIYITENSGDFKIMGKVIKLIRDVQ